MNGLLMVTQDCADGGSKIPRCQLWRIVSQIKLGFCPQQKVEDRVAVPPGHNSTYNAARSLRHSRPMEQKKCRGWLKLSLTLVYCVGWWKSRPFRAHRNKLGGVQVAWDNFFKYGPDLGRYYFLQPCWPKQKLLKRTNFCSEPGVEKWIYFAMQAAHNKFIVWSQYAFCFSYLFAWILFAFIVFFAIKYK